MNASVAVTAYHNQVRTTLFRLGKNFLDDIALPKGDVDLHVRYPPGHQYPLQIALEICPGFDRHTVVIPRLDDFHQVQSGAVPSCEGNRIVERLKRTGRSIDRA